MKGSSQVPQNDQIVFRVSSDLYKRAKKAVRIAIRLGSMAKGEKLSDLCRNLLYHGVENLEIRDADRKDKLSK